MEKYKGEDLLHMDEETWQEQRASLTPNKPLQKTLKIANILSEQNPDVILLTEVGGEQSLSAFNQYFLNDEYLCFCPPSNSNRGIDLGILLRKNLPYSHELKNILQYEVEKKKKSFNRNVLQLTLKKDDSPLLHLFVVHLKSKLDFEKKDFWGLKARTEEVLALTKILNKVSKDNIPFIAAGDFNGNASLYHTDHEFSPLYSESNQFRLKDVLEIIQAPLEERYTHHYFKGAFRRSSQLDYLFLSETLWEQVIKDQSFAIRYTGEYGQKIDPPSSLQEKQSFPSDHNPLVVNLRLT